MSTHISSTILLVDDSPLGRKSLAAPLEGLGFEIVQAGDGHQALQLAGEILPDLILMDVKMPGMDGIEATRRLRMDPKLAEIPVLLITGHDDTTRLEGLEAGADDYLIKPFDPAEFRARVKTITRLNRYRNVHSSRAKFEQLVQLSPDGILLVDSDGHIRLANPAAAAILGESTPEALLDQDLLTFFAPAERPAWAEYLAGALTNRSGKTEVERREGAIRAKDGARRCVEAFAGTIKDEEAAVAQLILRDITFRKEAEAAIMLLNQELENRVEERTAQLALETREHQRSVENLRVSEARLQSALEAAQQGLWEWDLAEDQLHFDERWSTLHDCGDGQEPLPASMAAWEDGILSEDRAAFRRSVHQALSHGGGWLEAEYRVVTRRRAGSPRWILVRGRVRERDAAGRPLQLIGTAQDLTARKELETELLRARDRAEQATRAKSEFLANMSHEIRTPLNAVLGFCELLERDITEPRHMEYLRAISAGGRSLLSLINDILDLSKIEAGRLTLQPEPLDVAGMCREIRGIFAEKCRQKGLEFLLEISPDIPSKVLLDVTRLRQVLFNLIGNGIKFTRKGHVGLRASLEQGAVGPGLGITTIIFTVQDTGIGIPQEDQETIFEAFRQKSGQSTREFGGTGLGLTISSRLVEMMEGSLTVESVPEQGSTFTLRLPAPLADEEVGHEGGALAPVGDQPQEFKDAVVVVVDDNRLNRELVLAMLRDTALTLMEAGSGEEALQLAQVHQPDIMLLDLRMPGMDGRAVAERMRSDPGTSWIPIILLTAAATREEAEAAQQLEVDGFLTKPVRRQNLLRELQRFLPTRAAESIAEPRGDSLEESLARSGALPAQVLRSVSEGVSSFQEAAVPRLLQELVPWLRGPLLAEWKEARDSLMVSKIELIANQLKAAGTENSLPSLVDLGNEMMVAVQSYDVERMLASLEKFPTCVDNLENNLRSARALASGR